MKSILIIDDDPLITRTLTSHLASQGFEVHSAEDGEEGLRSYEKNSSDLVILDIRLPNLDGIEILKGLKERNKNVTVLVMTAYDDMKTTVEAIKAAGGILAYYPCWIDRNTKERKRGSRQVIAIPAYGEWGLNADPAAWILWDLTGQPFDTTPKGYPKDEPRLTAKMLSIGPTRGATIGLSAFMLLNDPDSRQQIERVWIVEGPSDLLTLWAAIPEADRGRHVVLSKAGGATSDVMPWQSKLLAGLKVAIVGDADAAGEVGVEKWCRALDGIAAEVRIAKLPFKVLESHGLDIRDWLNGVTEA